MKKYLLPENGNFYKANLHCHTTCSDGRLTPEEVKDLYKRHGYSIIAYTDHNVLVDHSDLADEDFLPLLGFEADITEPEFCNPRKTCHLCYISLEPENKLILWNRNGRYRHGRSSVTTEEMNALLDEATPDYTRFYSKAGINDVIRIGKEHGYFITYNHPTWSQEDYPNYTAYEGMDAMEIVNGSCLSLGYDEYNHRVYDDLLRTGHKIYCIAADDNHNCYPEGSPRSDSIIGATVIKADKLEYRTVTKAIADGHFYATTGPEIYELWFEGEELHIKCSDAVKVTLNTGVRRAAVAFCEGDIPVNEAVFKVNKTDRYVRLTVHDKAGKCAYTSAYFTDDLFAE